MTTEIECGEPDVTNCQLLRGWLRHKVSATQAPAWDSRTARRRKGGFSRLTRVKRGLHDGHTVVLQHVEQSRLSGIVETEEEELGVLVKQTKRREDVVNCSSNLGSAFLVLHTWRCFPGRRRRGCIHQLTIHMAQALSGIGTFVRILSGGRDPSRWAKDVRIVEGDG